MADFDLLSTKFFLAFPHSGKGIQRQGNFIAGESKSEDDTACRGTETWRFDGHPLDKHWSNYRRRTNESGASVPSSPADSLKQWRGVVGVDSGGEQRSRVVGHACYQQMCYTHVSSHAKRTRTHVGWWRHMDGKNPEMRETRWRILPGQDGCYSKKASRYIKDLFVRNRLRVEALSLPKLTKDFIHAPLYWLSKTSPHRTHSYRKNAWEQRNLESQILQALLYALVYKLW